LSSISHHYYHYYRYYQQQQQQQHYRSRTTSKVQFQVKLRTIHPCIHSPMHPSIHSSMHPFTCLRISSKTAAPATSTAERQTLPITTSLLLLLLLAVVCVVGDGNGLDLFSSPLANGWW
jgi:hypothetical protein